MKTIAIVTTESLPIMPVPCGGGGVRIWGIAEALRQHEIQCVFFLPEDRNRNEFTSEFVDIRYCKPELLHHELHANAFDAVLFEQWQPLTFLQAEIEIPIIVDLPGPLALEYYWLDSQNYHQHIAEKIQCLSKADYFICALERQWGYNTAWMTWAGVTPDEDRLAVVPFTYPEMPRASHGQAEDETLIFWGGMFWAWQDRSKPLETILQTMTQLRQGQLVIAGLTEEKAAKHNIDLSHHHITSLGILPFSEFVMELKRSTVAVDLSMPTTERNLSSDLRTGTALWAGTPCIVTPSSPWAKMIDEKDAGWIIEYGDEKGTQKILKNIIRNQQDIRGKRRGARAISDIISNNQNVKPLIKWLHHPIKRKPSPPFLEARQQDLESRFQSMRKEIHTLQHQKNELQNELHSIRSKLPFKIIQTLKKLTGK